MALTLTACIVGLAVGQLVAGPLSDVLGRRGPLLAGAVGFAVFSAACAVAPDVGTLLALRLGQGLLGAVGIVLARAVVRDLFDGPAAARGFAALMLVSGAAPIVAPVLGGQILRVTTWRGVFVVLAVLGLVLAVGVLLAVPETLPRAGRRAHGGGALAGLRTTGAAFRVLLGDRRVLACVCAAGLGFAAMFAYISGLDVRPAGPLRAVPAGVQRGVRDQLGGDRRVHAGRGPARRGGAGWPRSGRWRSGSSRRSPARRRSWSVR